MKQLLLKDFLLSRRQITGICLILLIFSLAHYPVIFFYFIQALALPHIMFADENKNKVNFFLQSLPLNSSKIIKSRYIYLFLTSVCVLIFVWGVGAITSLRPSYLLYVVYGSTVYSWNEILIFLSIVLIIYAICLPFMFRFSSSLIVHVIGTVTGILSIAFLLIAINAAKAKDDWHLNDGMMNWFRELVPLSPIVLFIIGIVMYGMSMKVSEQLVSKK